MKRMRSVLGICLVISCLSLVIVGSKSYGCTSCEEAAGCNTSPYKAIVANDAGYHVAAASEEFKFELSQVRPEPKDIDSVYDVVWSGTCEDKVYIALIDWGDGSEPFVASATNIVEATHVYKKARCAPYLLRVDLEDQAVYADDEYYADDLPEEENPARTVWGHVKVTMGSPPSGGTSPKCPADPGCIEASFSSDPSRGGFPSGLKYTSVGFEEEYSFYPFDSMYGENKNWRLMEDGNAVLEIYNNVLRLIWGGNPSEIFTKDQNGIYEAIVGDSTAVYEYQESPLVDRIVVYRPEGEQEKYENVVISGGHYRITSIVEADGKETTFNYGTNGLSSIVLPGARTISYTWMFNKLILIATPSGVALLPQYTNGRMTGIRYTADGTEFDRIDFTYKTGSGETHLIETFTRKDPSGTEYFRQEVDYVNSAGEMERMREVVAGQVIETTVEAPIAGYAAGSYKQVLADGSGTQFLIEDLAGVGQAMSVQRLDSASNVIVSSSRVIDYQYRLVKSATSVSGATSEWVYGVDIDSSTAIDWAKHLHKVTDGYGNYSEYRYNTDNQVESVLAVERITGGTQILSWSRSEYDEEDRPIRSYVLDGSDILTDATTTYDSYGQVVKTRDGEGRETHFVYDATTELLTEVGILEATTEYEYDPDTLRRTKVTLPEEKVIEYAYTATGNVKSVTQYIGGTPTPVAVVTTYSYDMNDYGSQLTEVKDAEGYKRKYAYDGLGRLATEEIYAGTTSWVLDASATYNYDVLGRLRERYDFKGQKTKYDYDSIGRMRVKRYMTGDVTDASIEYVYSNGGYMEEIKNWECGGCGSFESAVEYTYDATLERMRSRTSVFSDVGYDPGDRVIEYDYDGASRRRLLEYPNGWGETVEELYGYDLANRVVEVSAELVSENSPSTVAEYELNRASERTQVDYGNGAYVLYEYDDYGRLELLANMSASDATMSSFQYSYAVDGLVENVTLESGDVIDYEYDGLSRLREEWKRDATRTTSRWRRQYEWDKVGNRTKLIKDDGSGAVTYSYDYNGLGQLATMEWSISGTDYRTLYSYDLNGNLATKQEQSGTGGSYAADVSWTYTWDREDHLTKVVKEDGEFGTDILTVEYGYCASCGGAMKYRIERNGDGDVVSWLRYEYDGMNLLRIDEVYDYDDDGVLENPEDGDDDWRVINAFIHGPGGVGEAIVGESYGYLYHDSSTLGVSTRWYYHYDGLGNVTSMSYSSGSEATRMEMDAFGNQTDLTTWPAIDSASWKSHLTGKMYDEDTGLYYFIARWYDAEVGRFVSRDPVDSGHDYVLAEGNPVHSVDPSGLEPEPKVWSNCLGYALTHSRWVALSPKPFTESMYDVVRSKGWKKCKRVITSEDCEKHCNKKSRFKAGVGIFFWKYDERDMKDPFKSKWYSRRVKEKDPDGEWRWTYRTDFHSKRFECGENDWTYVGHRQEAPGIVHHGSGLGGPEKHRWCCCTEEEQKFK